MINIPSLQSIFSTNLAEHRKSLIVCTVFGFIYGLILGGAM